jgi:RNA polymerase sigma factor (sigma-70 family)
MDTLIVNLRRAMLARDGAARSDGELLEAFITQRDQAAFAALVRRHGGMVLGVCRRILVNAQDAEDAFQATYLVLARKAASVWPREQVASWLHGVAQRTALRARSVTAKRRAREKQVADMPEPEARPQDLWNDLRPLIDRELALLPEIYRSPILLCDLEGKSIKEATRQLGWPQGTVAGRLARGRKLLAQRLARRGLALSGPALALTLTQHAAAAVPPALSQATADAAIRFASTAGATVGAGAAGAATGLGVSALGVSAAVLTLARGVLQMMLVSKLKIPFGLILIAALALVLSNWTRSAPPPAEPPAAPPAARAAVQAAPPKKAPDEPAWKKDFRAAYGLQAGEHIKRIAPPYPACRGEYLTSRFQRPAGAIAFDDHFTVLRWKGDWAPAELAQHTLPVPPNEGVALSRVLDMTAGLSATRLRGLDDILAEKVTGDFVVRDGAAPEQIVPQLQAILKRDCGIAVSCTFQEVEEEIFVLSGTYQTSPLEGRAKHEIEIYAEHLTDRRTGGGGSGSFDKLLGHVERHINRRVLAGKIDALPNKVSWHYNVRSPMLKDPVRGIDTLAEDTNPLRVLANVAAQTGLTAAAEKRKVRVLQVERAKEE